MEVTPSQPSTAAKPPQRTESADNRRLQQYQAEQRKQEQQAAQRAAEERAREQQPRLNTQGQTLGRIVNAQA